MKDFVIFDFCETLVDFQSADRFINRILDNRSVDKNKFWKQISRFLSCRFFNLGFNKFFPALIYGKRMKLLGIRGITKSDIDAAAIQYQKELNKNLIKPLNQLLTEHIQKGDYLVIVSGGYTPYIEEFSKGKGIQKVFATKIRFKNNKCLGVFDGKDCMREEKRILVKNYIKKEKIIYSKSICYSDSKSDLPIMEWVDEGIVISKDKSQYWAKEYGFKEIIWKS